MGGPPVLLTQCLNYRPQHPSWRRVEHSKPEYSDLFSEEKK